MNYKYIVDTKLVAYFLIQRGRSISEIFNKIAELLHSLQKKGEVYLCFDVGHSDFRLKEQSYYKGHRRAQMEKKSEAEKIAHQKFNEDYINLIPLFNLLNVKVLGVAGVEADDMASIVCRNFGDDPDVRVTLITGDQDWFHMVIGESNVRMYDFPKHEIMYNKDIVEKYQLDSRRKFSVLKSIIGDKSDNIKCISSLAKVKGTALFDKLYTDFEDPTDEQITEALEAKVEEKPNMKVHPFHVADGRTTPTEAYLSNMRIADPFTDTKNMTTKQKRAFNELLKEPIRTSGVLSDTFMADTIKVFGYPVQLSNVAKLIYGVKDAE